MTCQIESSESLADRLRYVSVEYLWVNSKSFTCLEQECFDPGELIPPCHGEGLDSEQETGTAWLLGRKEAALHAIPFK